MRDEWMEHKIPYETSTSLMLTIAVPDNEKGKKENWLAPRAGTDSMIPVGRKAGH